MKSAVVLLSGGLDSTVAAYIARKDIGKTGELHAMFFSYGQKHIREYDGAFETAGLLRAKWVNPEIDFGCIAQSSLLEQEGSGGSEGIPSTWVPQRNSIFLALAFAYAEMVGADFVYTGFNIKDYSGYPDCRPEFVESMNRTLNLASKRFVEEGKGIGIVCPLMHKSKADIVEWGIRLGVDFLKTWSCYKGGEKACGTCDSCRLRLEAFRKVGIVDPVEYGP